MLYLYLNEIGRRLNLVIAIPNDVFILFICFEQEGSTALSISMDSRRKDLALLIYGSLNFDARGRIKLSPSVSFLCLYFFCGEESFARTENAKFTVLLSRIAN